MKIARSVCLPGTTAFGCSALMMTLSAMAASTSVTYQYDNAGRLITTTYSDTAKTKYSLDAAGNRKTIQSGPPGTVASNQIAPSPVLLVNAAVPSATVAVTSGIGSKEAN